ncbi:MAG: hypothetical protein ACRC3Y_16230, partial [Romboutsia sp.]|uniref:hypothetical protein n=1 Tax=Romboutsia sp. TaxID=1965302 RepID=UPI003F3049C6
MKHLKNVTYVSIISIVFMLVVLLNSKNSFEIKDIIQTNLSQSLKTVKITEEKIRIDDKKLSISIKMPEVHCTNEEVERYVNAYIRKNINEFVNHQRQDKELNKSSDDIDITINYNVAFEDENLLNIIIYKNTNKGRKSFELEKDSYVFDLKTGQRIYLNNFMKNNLDYQDIIKKNIYDY